MVKPLQVIHDDYVLDLVMRKVRLEAMVARGEAALAALATAAAAEEDHNSEFSERFTKQTLRNIEHLQNRLVINRL